MSETKYVASVSFGKDSLAMLLLILEKGLPLHEVVFYDTGMEFQAIYSIRDRILPILEEHGVKYTELHPPRPFLFDMLEKPVNSKKERPSLRLFLVWRLCKVGNRNKDGRLSLIHI